MLLIINTFSVSCVSSKEMLLTPCSVDDIKIGDNTEKIYATLKPKFSIKNLDHSKYIKEIDVFKEKKIL